MIKPPISNCLTTNFSLINISTHNKQSLGANVLEGTDLLLPHCRHDRHHKILSITESILDLREQIFIGWKPQVILGISIISQQTHKSILRNINKLVVSTIDMGNVTVVGRGNNIFKLLGSEDINTNKVTFSMPVLSSFGSGDLHNLARPAFDDNVTVLADGTGLLRVRLGGSGVGLRLEVVLLVRHGCE